MKRLFEIAIGQKEDETYFATVLSLTDNKLTGVSDTSFRTLLAKLNKRLRPHMRKVKNFPIPEPSRIIRPNGKGAPRLIVPARN